MTYINITNLQIHMLQKLRTYKTLIVIFLGINHLLALKNCNY